MPDRPNVRLVKSLVRRQLDQFLEQLESLNATEVLEINVPLEITNANADFRLELHITRLAVQLQLPGIEATRSLPLGAAANGVAKAREPPAAGDGELPRVDKDIHEKIYAKGTRAPEKAATIIRRTSYKVNSNSRQAVYDLAAAGKFVKHPGNKYSRPDAPDVISASSDPAKLSPSDTRSA